MSWLNSSRAVYGAELRAGALCLVDHGWPVVPGTRWEGTEWLSVTGSRGGESVPTVAGGVSAATVDPAQVARWWSVAPYSVLLATGGVLDVLEVPSWMGRRMAATLRSVGLVAPLAATPSGRWWFPVAGGAAEALPARLADAGVVRHGRGSWVIAPPSECADGLVHWRVSPSACGWRLPASDLVNGAAAEAARWRESEDDEWTVAQRPAGVVSGLPSA
jgi:hypothetical protein